MIFRVQVVEFAVLAVLSLMASAGHSFVMPNAARNEHSALLASLQEPEILEETTTTSNTLSTLFPKNKQVLKFVEPQTNVTVMLIGSMHYNPASIQLVETTVEDLAKSNQLGSVIIESCDIRWNKTQEMMDKKREQLLAKQLASDITENESFIDSNPNDKDFLGNEMRAAWEVATKYHRPTVLGDQRINITMDALQASLKDTAKDLFLGGPAGWKRSRDEIVANWKTTIPVAGNDKDDEPKYLNAFAFFDPRLLISLPVSLVKYPLSFLVKDPVPVGIVFAVLAFLNFYGDFSSLDGLGSLDSFSLEDFVAATTTPKDYPWTDYVFSAGIAILETVVFARLLLKPLLADRNEILAKSVLDQCQLYANQNNNNGFGGFFRSFLSLPVVDLEEPIVYVPGSDPESMLVAKQQAGFSGSNDGEEKIVVAVLGMAHCNGVMKLLREQKV